MDRSAAVQVALVVALVSLFAPSLRAQDKWPVALEANVGRVSGWQDGGYRGRTTHGLAAEILGAVRTASLGGGGLVAALSYGMHGGGGCEAICIQAPDGGCVPCFPDFSALALGVGYETANAWFRAMAGPTYVTGSTDRTRLDRDGTSTGGLQGRLDWALPVVAHISLCASLRGVLVPDYSGDSSSFLAGGVGLRLR